MKKAASAVEKDAPRQCIGLGEHREESGRGSSKGKWRCKRRHHRRIAFAPQNAREKALKEMRIAFANIDSSLSTKAKPTANRRAFIDRVIKSHRAGKRRA